MTGALQFTEHDWGRIERDWTAWWAHELDRPLVMIENPVWSRSPDELSEDFLLRKPVDELLNYYQSRMQRSQIFGDAWPRWFPFFGAGVVAGFLGVELVFSPETETIWFEPDEQLLKASSAIAHDPDNSLWQRVRTLTQSAVELWDRQVCVCFTDLGGNLDILASLQSSESLLLELVTNPGAVTKKDSPGNPAVAAVLRRVICHHSETGAGKLTLGTHLGSRSMLHAAERFFGHDFPSNV